MFIIGRILVLSQIYDALDLYFLYYIDFTVHWDFLYNQCVQYIQAHLYDKPLFYSWKLSQRFMAIASLLLWYIFVTSMVYLMAGPW